MPLALNLNRVVLGTSPLGLTAGDACHGDGSYQFPVEPTVLT